MFIVVIFANLRLNEITILKLFSLKFHRKTISARIREENFFFRKISWIMQKKIVRPWSDFTSHVNFDIQNRHKKSMQFNSQKKYQKKPQRPRFDEAIELRKKKYFLHLIKNGYKKSLKIWINSISKRDDDVRLCVRTARRRGSGEEKKRPLDIIVFYYRYVIKKSTNMMMRRIEKSEKIFSLFIVLQSPPQFPQRGNAYKRNLAIFATLHNSRMFNQSLGYPLNKLCDGGSRVFGWGIESMNF
jgi:hypothetical protein